MEKNLFSKYYDDIFPLNQDTVDFLLAHFEKGKTLDLGSATGEYSLALSRKGYETLGIDIDPQMVHIALEKTKRLSLLGRFLEGNCLDVVYVNQFKNVFCIGNTLVHLKNKEEIRTSLKHVHESLLEGGHLVISIINYDRILDQDIKGLPTIKNDTVTFERKYVLKDEYISFDTVLTVGEDVEVSSTPLFPIRSQDLIKICASLGFKDIVSYGNMLKDAFDKDKSYHLVLVMKK
ncbi:MAG: class I SAM-dependent methyltransferase [Candidatus Izemoplasmatales bacterium]